MKTLIKLEELTLVVLSFYLFLGLDYAWWWFPLFFFLPDVSLLGYAINQNVGAITYNVLHHKALAVMFYLLGSFAQFPGLQVTGLVLFGHSSFDRLLGFELQQSTLKGK
jgi:hypothetical protein